MSGAWWLPPDLGRRPLACGNTGRGDRVLTCGLFVPNGEPLFAAVPLSTRGGVLSTNAVRQVRPVRPGTPGFAPYSFPWPTFSAAGHRAQARHPVHSRSAASTRTRACRTSARASVLEMRRGE